MLKLFLRKGQKVFEETYRPISILPLVLKIFERIICKQLTTFFDNIPSKHQCGFRKGQSTQHCLLVMLQKWKKALDYKEVFGALLTDLSKAFDCLNHELLIGKLHAYGLFFSSLKLVLDYLLNCKHRTKVNSKYIAWTDIFEDVPQGPTLGPLMFNIFLWDLLIFIETTYSASCADDNAPYVIKNTIAEVSHELETVSKMHFMWFIENEMVTNVDKSHLLLSSVEDHTIEINGFIVKNSHCENLLRVHLDDQLKFDFCIEKLCKNANRKLHALARVTPYMDLSKKRILINAFFDSQFNYCSLIWMCHSRKHCHKINRLHEKCLRIIYDDKRSSYEEL